MSIRKFIHCDCDCFFAAVEIRDDPSLKGLPVAVGGSSEKRGVIATCNYEARKYGVHSAMASATALRRCSDLIIIPGNMDKYREASIAMHTIFNNYTDLIEPLSLDEAYLDVSESDQCKGSATLIAEEIRQRVKKEIGISLSAGIAPNKFLAKIASDWNKPDGQFVIRPDQIDGFILGLPVKKLHGVGKVTAKKMADLGILNCKDLQQFGLIQLIEMFGNFGERLYSLCRGIDNRTIVTEREHKSISIEHTYSTDLKDKQICLNQIPDLHDRLITRIKNSKKQVLIGKLFVKIKFNDFVTTTVEQNSDNVDLEIYRSLCATGYARGNKPVRLIGLGVRMKPQPEDLAFKQLKLRFKEFQHEFMSH